MSIIMMSRQLPSRTVMFVCAASMALALFLTGCGGFMTTAPARVTAQPQPINQHREPTLAPLGPPAGRIVSLNPEQNFVVIDFTSHMMPAVGTRVTIYRNGKQVGAVRITEPVRAQLATADIVEGEVHVGDEVR
jgi:hypothetical protein